MGRVSRGAAGSVSRKVAPPAPLRSTVEAAAMRLDDGAADREADAHPALPWW